MRSTKATQTVYLSSFFTCIFFQRKYVGTDVIKKTTTTKLASFRWQRHRFTRLYAKKHRTWLTLNIFKAGFCSIWHYRFNTRPTASYIVLLLSIYSAPIQIYGRPRGLLDKRPRPCGSN